MTEPIRGTLHGSKRVHLFEPTPQEHIVESACGVVGRISGDRQNITPYEGNPHKDHKCPGCYGTGFRMAL